MTDFSQGRSDAFAESIALRRRSAQALAVIAVSMLGRAAVSLQRPAHEEGGCTGARSRFGGNTSASSLVPLTGTIQPGASTDVGLHFVLDKGWHVYWTNAGDSGEPPKIGWKLPQGITASAMQFPAPERLPLGPLMDFGYENEVLFPMTLQAQGTSVTLDRATSSSCGLAGLPRGLHPGEG